MTIIKWKGDWGCLEIIADFVVAVASRGDASNFDSLQTYPDV